ncbi:MAG: holo-ACP synthase [Patescibacteria group bacterium]
MINNIGIGLDIENIGRFTKLDLKKNRNFFDRIYTQKEKEYSLSKPNHPSHFAARFAAKEAVKKTIRDNVAFNEIEITNDKNGAPKVKFLNKRMEKKYKSIISISHTKSIVQAVCITFKK